ncbi:MAG: iron-sulfur cluster assembly accessory protein [Alphaproteobacteria bacterium]|nr:iron-sulfur cluster assembly accessory protein [Alphaproteobacteria bacterium]
MNEIANMPKAISLTDAAAKRVQEIIAQSNENYVGLRLGLKNAGCAGMEYTMEYATDIAPHDEIIKEKGVTILIDAKALLFLLGTEMDYEISKLSSGFTFKNPNQTDACGCGESVTLIPSNGQQGEQQGEGNNTP